VAVIADELVAFLCLLIRDAYRRGRKVIVEKNSETQIGEGPFLAIMSPAGIGAFSPSEKEKRMEAGKNSPQTIDEYIAAYPPDVQAILQQVRATIREAAPGAQEAIKYQLPTFVLHGNLVHFGAFQKHIGFYPAPRGLEEFKQELSAYKGSKGAVQFPLDQPIPYELIRRITEFRVQENLAKAAAKGKKKTQISPD
jgi:uncharacterized protein YdhG (YjbR/CyaY superfamily)